MNTKLHPSWPWFLLTALLGLVPVLNNKYPASFFPAVPSGVIELVTVFGGALTAAMGFARLWALLVRRSTAREFIREVLRVRCPVVSRDPGEAANAERTISRLVRHLDRDLAEMGPDFSPGSIGRLKALVPELLLEIQTLEDAMVRVGIVGTYLGEVACRHSHWKWVFQTEPHLRQFGYLSSILQNPEGDPFDPYEWAADLMTGRAAWGKVLERIQK